ncbi:MAG TPA: FkbM family methyltransferase [Candidatus Eisenbacteria bacterium]|nr:FkbM family methyltransferase [Candidatus Eisenbacteria bacterium]
MLAALRRRIEKSLKIDHECLHTYVADLGPGSVVVDLGAHVGQFSKAMAGRFRATCYAVEPSPDLFRSIPSDDLIRPVQAAIAGEDGPVLFYPHDNAESGNTLGRLPRSDAPCPVEGVRFDSLLKKLAIGRIDLLKIDIEGSEVALFEGTDDRLLENVRQITVEFHDFVPELDMAEKTRAIVHRLESLGFLVHNHFRLNHIDMLFLNTRKFRFPFLLTAYLRWMRIYFRLRNLYPRVKTCV